MKRLPSLMALLAPAVVFLAGSIQPLVAAPDEPAVAGLRAHVQEMEAHLRELKAGGQEQEAREVRARLEGAQQELRRLRMRERQENPEAQMMQQRLAEMRGEIKRLHEAGRLDEARELAEAARNFQREARDHRESAAGEPRARRGEEPRRPAGEELERRLRHIHVAVENLRAAGLSELAEHAARAGEEMRRELERMFHAPGEPAEPVRALQAQIEELHRAMGELREQMERLRHEPRP
ncbi:MAG: hypothetical protein H7A47_02475 [Verrucomicrobiales bacterium]|nr:hypothetical protein [Verrucomicrobiales bacterium]